MLAGLKELKDWVTGLWQPELPSGEEEYQNLEFTAVRHLRNPYTPSPLTYEEQSRIKAVIYH